jgi:hypothetical protein
MALGDNTTSVAHGATARGRQPYMIEYELDIAQAVTDKGSALAAADVIPGLTIPAYTLVLAAGWEVLEVHTGTSTDADWDFGVSGGDVDNFVDGFAFDAAAVGDVAFKATQTPVVIGATADTIDVRLTANTGTTLTGKLRLWAVCMDIDGYGASLTADEVDRDTLA